MRAYTWMLFAVVSLGLLNVPSAYGQGGWLGKAKEAVGGAGDAVSDRLAELDRQRLQKTEQLARATRIDELRRQAERAINDFNRLRKDAENIQNTINEARRLSQMDQRQVRKEAYSKLRSMGVMGSNRNEVLRQLRSGLTIFIPAAEFDHVDQAHLAASAAASVASANPGPLLAQLKQFVMETKQQFLRNLRNVPNQMRGRLEREFEHMLLQAVSDVLNGRRPRPIHLQDITVEVNIATFTNWVDLRYKMPELQKADNILGVQLYRIAMSDRHDRVPLPNTFLPYVRMHVQIAR